MDQLSPHPSDRIYYILEGECEVILNGEESETGGPGDLFIIPSSTTHSIRGQAKYIVVTSPPFAPENEQVLS